MEPFFSPAVSLPVLMLHSAFSLSFHINSPVINIIPISNLLSVTKSGSKGSLFGGLTGAALMASAYYLMQSTETKAIGDALGFGSAFLFSCVFGMFIYSFFYNTFTLYLIWGLIHISLTQPMWLLL
uniref:Uncharacterized protein n=1 Tax=Gossypium raimondii TaxID=29730 RepID=A0A0D2RDQ3_GOSRA|nr:hypothetical protein B456_003G072100 [Gossypium raimondii]